METAQSKKKAKHLAAINLLKILEVDFEAQFETGNFPKVDIISTLLDTCKKRNLPMASFELVNTQGLPHSPTFTYKCTLSHHTEIATNFSKKAAKQEAAKAMLSLVQETYPDNKSILEPLELVMETEEIRTANLFKSYEKFAEPMETDSKFISGVNHFPDRCNFFVNLPPEKYHKALAVLTTPGTDKEKVQLLADALGYALKIYRIPGNKCQLTVLELECNFETVHVGTEEQVYHDFLFFMKIMLNTDPLITHENINLEFFQFKK